MLNKLKNRKQEGFTIIEVLIVLAIAGLIMVVVFLAVPNLQRSQRNNARQSDGNNLLTNVSEYVGNSNGALPSACATLAACSWITYAPQQLTTVSLQVGGTLPTAPGKSAAIILTNFVCNGVVPTATGATARDYVIWHGIEGSTGTTCTKGS